MPDPEVEMVVLLAEDGTPCGAAPKAEVHHAATPLHLAFSCWVLDADGRTLLTQRAAAKKTWPMSWTNSFCGHPGPGESPEDAVHRRARDELGVRITTPEAVLPDYRYRAVMPDGTVENEICPVYVARLLDEPAPNPDEVGDWAWVDIADLAGEVAADGQRYSPWMREQLDALQSAGWPDDQGAAPPRR